MDHSEEQIKQIFAVNVYGPIFLTQETIPYMPKGGRVVNISSIASKLGFDSIPIYGAAKAALDSLSYAWAQEFGRSKGTTVNSVSPGPVSTDILPEGADENILFAEMIKRTRAAERVGTVQDIADIVLLISSEKGRWITGQSISASGGITGP
jgi:NAD(P)-dependent dehydrogenase (short-subunit alcohol dehydrogenase family)